jgi:parvulin-like peptidyl-prolyl isomerase
MDSSAAQGGDTGYASKDNLAPEYADAAFSLPIGTVALVRTQAGYHVIKVVDRKKEGLFTLEEIKPSYAPAPNAAAGTQAFFEHDDVELRPGKMP